MNAKIKGYIFGDKMLILEHKTGDIEEFFKIYKNLCETLSNQYKDITFILTNGIE